MRSTGEREHLRALVDIGLNLREARIYLNLLTRKEFTAPEIARLAKLPRTSVYEFLKKMVFLGLCKEKAGKIRSFEAIPPEIALSGLLANQKEEFQTILQERKEKIDKLIQSLSSLFETGRDEKDPLDYIEILRDTKQIASKFFSLERKAEREIIGFTKPPYVVAPQDNEEELVHLNRGVSFRIIYELDGTVDEMKRAVGLGPERGEQARIIKSLPSKLVVFDGKISLLPMKDPIAGKHSFTVLSIEHEGIASMLKEAFESFWSRAVPFEEYIKNPSVID